MVAQLPVLLESITGMSMGDMMKRLRDIQDTPPPPSPPAPQDGARRG